VKNKIAPPFREVELDVLFNEWISLAGEILDIWVERSVIKKSWAFYSYGDTRLGQGRDNARDFLKADSKLMNQIEQEVRSGKTPNKWEKKTVEKWEDIE
jgi:recombination protein RecA